MKISINAYIIEDNIMHRKIIQKQLADFSKKSSFIKLEVFPMQNYVEYYKNPSAIPISSTDIFIIDIDLNTFFTGIQLAKKIRLLNPNVFILFLTGDSTKGIDIINEQIKPTGYILKQPINNVFLEQNLNQLLEQIEQTLRTHGKDTLMVRSGRKQHIIVRSDIVYISSVKGKKRNVIIKTKQNEILCNEKLFDLKIELDDKRFYKELKSFIINFDFIESYNQLEGRIIFKDQTELHFGTKVISKLKKALIAYNAWK
ncbi:response regulator [Erwinia sp. CPCC 100877]|nr:response regulator [Erwinia sp. CPCC 100877]